MIQPWNFTCLWHLWQKILSSSKPQDIRSWKRKPTREELPVSLTHSRGGKLGLWSRPCSSPEQGSLTTKLWHLSVKHCTPLHSHPIFPCLQSNRVIINSVADPCYLGILSILSLFSFHSERAACQNSNIFFLVLHSKFNSSKLPHGTQEKYNKQKKKKIKAQRFDLSVGDEKGNGKTPIGFLKENQQKLLNI